MAKTVHVGASLLAKTPFQPLKIYWMYRRLREQARSHRICGPLDIFGKPLNLSD
jgi:hypothetical protein